MPGMAALRRSLFNILAAFAMLCGLSWTAAAYACPEPVVTQPANDDCTQAPPINRVMPYCGPVCLGVMPSIPAIEPVAPMHVPAYIAAVAEFHGHPIAPDPPPPRSAERWKSFHHSLMEKKS